MPVYVDDLGFITTQANAAWQVEAPMGSSFVLPRFFDGVWIEGSARRVFQFDDEGYYTIFSEQLDPRTTANFTFEAIPAHIILPKFNNGRWIEALISHAVSINENGFVIEQLHGVDPRAIDGVSIALPPASTFRVPKIVNGEWTEANIPLLIQLDNDGYPLSIFHSVDPRTVNYPYTTLMIPSDFIAPVFMDGEWIDEGIDHAWMVDEDGFFIGDAHRFDPRTATFSYTVIPLASGQFRKPQLVNDEWVEANPITENELIEQARNQKYTELSQQQNAALIGGVPYRFGDTDDSIQTRHERDLINITGITTRAILLQAQGVEDAAIQFRAESNKTYLLTPGEAILLGQAVAVHSEEIYTKGWDLKDRLSQADELEDIEAIVW